VLVEGAAENLKGSFLFGVLLLPKLKLSLDVEVTLVGAKALAFIFSINLLCSSPRVLAF
jgi:hypothetical protein